MLSSAITDMVVCYRQTCSILRDVSQNSHSGKGPLEINQSTPPAKGRSPRAGRAAMCQVLNVSGKGDSPAACSNALPPSSSSC